MMMVAYFRHWAAQQPGGADLVVRLHSMMHLERDPLDPTSAARWVLNCGSRGWLARALTTRAHSARAGGSVDSPSKRARTGRPRTNPPKKPPRRYRLQLRPADQEFFRTNVLEHFLPWRYHLAAAVDTPGNSATAAATAALPIASTTSPARRGRSSELAGAAAGGGDGGGVAVATAAAAAAAVATDGEEAAGAASSAEEDSYPLANETWWRLYQVACFMRGELQAAMDVGLPLQVRVDWVLFGLRLLLALVLGRSTATPNNPLTATHSQPHPPPPTPKGLHVPRPQVVLRRRHDGARRVGVVQDLCHAQRARRGPGSGGQAQGGGGFGGLGRARVRPRLWPQAAGFGGLGGSGCGCLVEVEAAAIRSVLDPQRRKQTMEHARPHPHPQSDLLQALPASRRGAYADRWLEMESLLGRPTFHRLFNHVLAIDRAAGREYGGPDGEGGKNGSAASSKTAAAASGWQARVSGGGGSGARGVLQSQSEEEAAPGAGADEAGGPAAFGGAGSAALLRHFGRACTSGEAAAAAALESVLDFGHKLLMVRQNDWGQLRSEGGAGPAIAAQLEEVCFFVNLFRDDAWQPWALEFFCRSDDDQKRRE
jgi:hypothetical protein